MELISREKVFKEKLAHKSADKVVEALFQLAEELGICGDWIQLQNKISEATLAYFEQKIKEQVNIPLEVIYYSVSNMFYILGLYLLGYYNKDEIIDYETFLNLVLNGKSFQLIDEAYKCFKLHVNRMKRTINKSKKKLPRGEKSFLGLKKLLKELDQDLSIYETYPLLKVDMGNFVFGRIHGLNGPVTVPGRTGFINCEHMIYSLYNEVCILTKFEVNDINNVIKSYAQGTGYDLSFNLFEKVVNNYLFALPYSDSPEKLQISKVDAGLLMNELKLGTICAKDLINQLIDRFNLDGYKKAYMEEYSKYLEERIKVFRETNYFSELFLLVAPPPD